MKQKKILYTEISYVIGLVILAFGTAFMEKANFGLSMVVAPAYLLHLKISEILPFFSFGMAEYFLQAVLLVILGLFMRRFKISYFFSFVTAVIYGFVLDASMFAVGFIPLFGIPGRVVYYIVGMLFCSIGIAFLFHTYISPEAYELLVKEISAKYRFNISKVKTIYDCTSCLIAIIMSFAFFGLGHFEGVKLGTVICALINGTIIGFCGKILDSVFEYKDGLSKFKKIFEK